MYNFTIDYPLSYDEIHRNDQSKIYPNPSNGIFNIEFEDQQAQQVMVSDVMGRIVFESQLKASSEERFTLDLTNQAPGVYIITLIYGNRSEQHKVIVQ